MSTLTDYQQTADKYAYLLVPDYDAVEAGTQASYLCLGATPSGAGSGDWGTFGNPTKGCREHTDGDRLATTRGRELAIIGGTYELHVRGASAPTAYEGASAQTTFRDADETYVHVGKQSDARFPSDGSPSTLAEGEGPWPPPHLPAYLLLSADLQKKTEIEEAIKIMKERVPRLDFTWEDHTAGHRISTTGGDKIEIIRGKNYTHVLGADDFDVSEGELVIARTGPNPKAYPGETVPADEKASKKPFLVDRTWAKRSFSESWYGEGLETPASKLGLDAAVSKQVDPAVVDDGESVEYTYASKLRSFTGAADAPVAVMHDETHVGTATSLTKAGTITETTTSDMHTEYTTGGLHTEFDMTQCHSEFSLSGGHFEFELSGVHLELEAAGAKFEFTFAPLHLELEFSSHFELSFGEDLEYKAHCTELSSAKDEFFLKKASTGLTFVGTAISHKFTALKTALGI